MLAIKVFLLFGLKFFKTIFKKIVIFVCVTKLSSLSSNNKKKLLRFVACSIPIMVLD